MIDHVSIAVSDLAQATRFYEALLAAIGFSRLETRPATVGFGKTYAEFWLNQRPDMIPVTLHAGVHVCFRAKTMAAVDTFHAAALDAGGTSDGAPARRPQYGDGYYAAFIRDSDGNRIEAVTFVRA